MPSQYRAEEEGGEHPEQSIYKLDELTSHIVYKDLVERLHAHVARLTKSLGTHSKALEELKDDAAPRSEIDAMRQQMSSYEGQVNDLRTSINSLSNEIAEVRHLVEGLVSGRSDAVAQQQQQPQDTWPQTHGYKSFKSEPARLGPQKSARTLASYLDPRPASAPPYAHQRCAPRDSQALDPELQRAEAILRSMPSQTPHEHLDCSTCQHQPRHGHVSAQGRQRAMPGRRNAPIEEDEGFAEYDDDSILPPQALLSRQLHELESDFASHKKSVGPFIHCGRVGGELS